MRIDVQEDLTGLAPAGHRYSAADADTFDGATDSATRNQIGYGATPVDAILALGDLLLPDLTDAEIEALAEDELTRQAQIEWAIMSEVLARDGRVGMTIENIVVEHAECFGAGTVEAASEKLAALAKLAPN